MARPTIRRVLLEVSRQWLQQAADGDMAIETVDLYIQISERFDVFADAHGIHRMDDVTGQLTESFMDAPGHDRHDNITLVPKDGTRRQRRSALASLFAHARALGMTQAVPLLDSPPIPRPPRSTGAELTGAEIEDLQFHSERGMPATRHAALLALLLSGLGSAEAAQATAGDLDLSLASVTTEGSTRTTPRTCPLSPWAVRALRLRTAYLAEHRPGGAALSQATPPPGTRRRPASALASTTSQGSQASPPSPAGSNPATSPATSPARCCCKPARSPKSPEGSVSPP